MNKVIVKGFVCLYNTLNFNLVSDITIKSGKTLCILKKVLILCSFLTNLCTLEGN